uniref:Uncharacterized protein n=1 Tax=Knipowitschia caucasica TaxID=637954 RepID=A0AAV2JVM6_KNICA
MDAGDASSGEMRSTTTEHRAVALNHTGLNVVPQASPVPGLCALWTLQRKRLRGYEGVNVNGFRMCDFGIVPTPRWKRGWVVGMADKGLWMTELGDLVQLIIIIAIGCHALPLLRGPYLHPGSNQLSGEINTSRSKHGYGWDLEFVCALGAGPPLDWLHVPLQAAASAMDLPDPNRCVWWSYSGHGKMAVTRTLVMGDGVKRMMNWWWGVAGGCGTSGLSGL